MPASEEPPLAGFVAAFDTDPRGLALVQLDGTFRRVNRALAALLGYRPHELVGRRYQELTPAADAPLDVEGTRRLVRGEDHPGRVDKRLVHRDGRPLWVRVAVTPLPLPDGTLWGGLAHVQPLQATDPAGAVGSPADGSAADGSAAWAALHDPLTGAANRLLLHDRIALALAACERDGGVVAVLFCDVDDFKAVNDTAGHDRGDQVLTAVVRRLQTTLRPDDTVARVGGDEFVAAAHVATAGHAAQLHDRVRTALDAPLGLPDDPALTVGVSLGLAVAHPGDDTGRLLADADRAMYADKRRRRESGPAAVS